MARSWAVRSAVQSAARKVRSTVGWLDFQMELQKVANSVRKSAAQMVQLTVVMLVPQLADCSEHTKAVRTARTKAAQMERLRAENWAHKWAPLKVASTAELWAHSMVVSTAMR